MGDDRRVADGHGIGRNLDTPRIAASARLALLANHNKELSPTWPADVALWNVPFVRGEFFSDWSGRTFVDLPPTDWRARI
jgi:hypothetical protein